MRRDEVQLRGKIMRKGKAELPAPPFTHDHDDEDEDALDHICSLSSNAAQSEDPSVD